MSRATRRVRCMECGERVPRNLAIAYYDEAGQLIGFLCRSCNE